MTFFFSSFYPFLTLSKKIIIIMGASCSSATPVSDEDQEQDQEQQQQLPQRRQSEREVAPKDKDKEDEDENPEHHHHHQQQQQQPTEVSAGRRQQSNISTSSRYLNSLIRGGGGGGGNTATEHTDSVILQPVRLPSHQSHRIHHQNPNQQQQQQLNSGSSGQGPIRYRLEDVRPFASSHFAQLLQEQQQQQEQEEEGTLENDENRYDRSLVQRYLEKSTSLSSSGSGQMGKEGNGPRGKAAITVSKSKLQLGGSSAGRSNLLQSPVKGKGERGRRAAAAAANSSTTSTSTSTTSATSILSNRRSLRGKESVTGKRKPHSRLSVDSEKTIYQCKKKSAAAHSAAATAAAAKTRAQKQQHQQQPRPPPQLPTPLQQQQHQQQCLSLMAHSRDRVIEQVKSGAQVPTPLVLKVRGYVFQRVVASGAHSTLYQVLTYRMHTQELACKHIHKGAFPPQSQAIMRAFLKEETAILGQVKHDNIVSMLEIITTPTDVYIIMNFAANGTIFDYLYKEWKKPLPETMARRWMRDLMLGLEYLHDRMAIVHRDLKLENFLLTERYDALLSDFGLAVQLKQPQAARLLAVHCGTADYMAPELNVTNHGGAAYHVNPLPADIYAMGVSLFELLNYYRPYALSFSASSHSVLYRQQHRLYQLNRRVVLDLAAQRLLAALLEPVPVKRPKAAEVLAHDWFRGPTAS